MSESFALYANAGLREIEKRAERVFGGEDVLMRRAGLAAWRCVLAHWPQAQRVLVVCGPGNNGGDGYVLARHAQEAGRDVRVLRLPAHAPRGGLAQRMEGEYRAACGRVIEFDGDVPATDLIVDALFGIGLSRAPEGGAAALIQAVDAVSTGVLALDAPSGVDADSGDVPGAAVRATRTLQFIAAHRGLATGAALDHVGTCEMTSLEIPEDLLRDITPAARALIADDLHAFLEPRDHNSHKGKSGRVLCIGGDHGKGGAIALCAEAALRSGAGLVDVATRAAHVPALLARRPELMVHAIDADTAADDLLETLRELVGAADVVALGPGLGQAHWGHRLFDAVIDCGKPLVIDADALNLLARNPVALPADCVLTPHPGEAARLLGVDTQHVQRDRYAAANDLCERYGCTVVLKGAGTVVVAPGEIPRVIAAGNPGMATGGMGDLLTGVIAALRAQGLSSFDAAAGGALLHGAAGDAAAGEGGERGLLPSDLFTHLRRLANP